MKLSLVSPFTPLEGVEVADRNSDGGDAGKVEFRIVEIASA
jgi:hypothetical protein